MCGKFWEMLEIVANTRYYLKTGIQRNCTYVENMHVLVGEKGLRNTRGRYRRMDRISARTRDNRGSILCSFKGSMERRGETSTPRLGDTLIE